VRTCSGAKSNESIRRKSILFVGIGGEATVKKNRQETAAKEDSERQSCWYPTALC